MPADDEPQPRRSPPRPVRVAWFDGLSTRDLDADAVTEGRRVVDLDGLDEARSPTKVAEFDDLDAVQSPVAPVVRLDTVVARRRGRSADGATVDDARVDGGPSRRADGRPRVVPDRAAAGGERADPSAPPLAPGADLPEGDGIPPDGPLPRGRRRRAQVGRLGPDAPDPDEPQPEADPVAVAREICLRLLTERARTRRELAQALARKGVAAEAAAAVLDRFDEVGLVDDAAFAAQWVRSRHTYRGLGRRAIAVELRRKGVCDDVAGEALAEVDGEAEARRARELVDRKLRALAVDTAEQRAGAARRLVGMLARKGYGASTAYQVVRDALAERGADVDELGTEPTE